MRTRNTTMTTAGPWPAAAVGSPSPQRIRWGAVFGGAVIGIALLALLTTLWFALAYGSGMEQIRGNLEWYVGGSAIVCLFVAGLLAGWLSGVNGAGSGFFNGVTIWALILVVVLSVGIPSILNVFNLGRVAQIEVTGGLLGSGEDVLWAAFLSILGGLVACGLGGMIGGALTSPANAHLVDDVEDTHVAERPDRDRTVVLDDDDDHEDETTRVHHRAS
ncbi:MAG: hypothetical protein ACRDHC_12060 [Actinomycetota bacterium]